MAVTKNVDGDVIPSGKQMHPDYSSHVSNAAILTENGTADRLPDGHDAFYIGADERKEYGIPDHMEPVWIRDDRWWGNKVSGNRAQEFKRTNKGGEIVKLADGSLVVNEDLILAMRPRELMDGYRAIEAKETADFERRAKAAEESDALLDESDFDRRNLDQMMALKRANQRRNQQAGMIGNSSQSQGLGIEDYIRNKGLTAEQVFEEELNYARGRHTDVSIDDLKQIAREMGIGPPKSGGGKNTTYSLPPNIRPRNLAKA